MCLQILNKKGQQNNLSYVPGAVAYTDPPKLISEFIKQRRRWINGSNFAQFFVIKNFCKLNDTNHSKSTKCWIYIFYIYYTINTGFGLFVVGMMYSSYSIMIRDFVKDYDPTIDSQNPPQDYNTLIAKFLEGTYLFLLLWILLISLAADLDHVKAQLNCIVLGFGLIMTMFIIAAYIYFISNLKGIGSDEDSESEAISFQIKLLVIIAMSLVVFSQLIPICISCRCNLFKIVYGFICYIFMTPTYINVFIIYSFCNVHDISWGNRESAVQNSQSNKEKKKLRQSQFKTFRLNLLIVWLIINLFGSYIINTFARDQNGGNVILVFSLFLAFTVFFRLMSAITQRFLDCFTCRRYKRKVIEKKQAKKLKAEKDRPYQKPEFATMPSVEKRLNKQENR